MSLKKEQKQYLILGEFTQKYIQYEELVSKYRELSSKLPNIKPSSLHFYNDWEDGRCTTKHRDNFSYIDGILSQINEILEKITKVDERIMNLSKEYFKLFGEIIPIRSMNTFKNEDSLKYIENKMEAINGRRKERK